MSMKTGAALIAALVVAGCSGGAERPADENTATAAVQTRDTTGTPDSTGMAGMDHGNMDHGSMAGMDHGGMTGMQGDAQAAGGAGMAGMDHSGMPGMSDSGAQAGAEAMDHSNMPGMRAGGASAGTAGMDHSGMAGMAGHATPSSRRGAAAVDHSQMAGMQGMDHSRMQPSSSDRSGTRAPQAGHTEMGHGAMKVSGQAGTMAGMDHAGMPHDAPAEASNDAGMEKLRALVAELVQDPRVQTQIQADTALRRRWADEGVRRILLNRP